MRVPGRIHITWQDEQTLRLDTDAGQQVRTFYFGTPRSQDGDWQGVSQASWDMVPGPGGIAGAALVSSGALKSGPCICARMASHIATRVF